MNRESENPDPDAAVNKFRTERVPLNEICSWHGF